MTSLINTPEKLTDEEFESLPWILSCQKDSYQYSKEAIVKKCYELKIWNSLYSTPSLESKDSNNDSSQKKKKKKKKKKSNEPKVIEPEYRILLNDGEFLQRLDAFLQKVGTISRQLVYQLGLCVL